MRSFLSVASAPAAFAPATVIADPDLARRLVPDVVTGHALGSHPHARTRAPGFRTRGRTTRSARRVDYGIGGDPVDLELISEAEFVGAFRRETL